MGEGKLVRRCINLAAALVVLLVSEGLPATASAATTTSETTPIYDYDLSTQLAQRAHSNGGVHRSQASRTESRPGDAEQGSPRLVIAAKGGASVVTTGQRHHVISTRIARALEENPNLAGRYSARDARFTTQAVDEAAHRGYQTWHRELDDEIVGWLQRTRAATPEQFESFLRGRYARPDLSWRFPNGF